MAQKIYGVSDRQALKFTPVENSTPLLMSAAAYNPGIFQYQPLPYFPAQPAAPVAPAAPVEPVSTPTYAKASAKFGTMRQIEPIRDHFINARVNLEALRDIATKAPGTGKSLIERVETYLQKQLGEGYTALINELGVTADGKGRFLKKPLPKLGASFTIPFDEIAEKAGTVSNLTVTHNTHSALFATGVVMTDDIRTMEALRHALVKVRRQHQQTLEKKQAELAELTDRISNENSTLKGLEARRSELLDDYAVAQRLLAEHWQEVEQQWAERKRVIESSLGLYYVRVRETPLSRTLPDPLDLRPGSTDDLVPGCANRTAPLPDELLPFMATLLDIPAADWATLSGLANQLPGRIPLERMVLRRRQLLEVKLRQPATPTGLQPTLSGILQNHLVMQQTIAAKPFAVTALREMQQQGHKILALEDLLASSIPALREPANQLHQRLNAAAGCLLRSLRTIKPSIRLAWADLADDNQLAVESPERWPSLARAEAYDFNSIRTLVELIGWWFRQLDGNASGDSRTAMGNFVRACLLLAASDDPQQLLQGQLKSLPSRLRPGELLRLDLNREPAAGNLLQLLDATQQVIATVRVEDHDSKGTLASITSVINPNAALTLALRVTGLRN